MKKTSKIITLSVIGLSVLSGLTYICLPKPIEKQLYETCIRAVGKDSNYYVREFCRCVAKVHNVTMERVVKLYPEITPAEYKKAVAYSADKSWEICDEYYGTFK